MKAKFLMLAAVGLAAGNLIAEPSISNLTAEYRNGQVFLQWNEKELPPDARLSVWSSDQPLTPQQCAESKPAAALLNPGSSSDWWYDTSNFVRKRSKKLKSEEIFAGAVADEKTKAKTLPGLVIADGGKKARSRNGLHVHTVRKAGRRYFAVGWYRKGGKKPEQLIALTSPVTVNVFPVMPISLSEKSPKAGSGKGRALIVFLHGRGGGVGVDKKGNPTGNFIFYADDTLAWREGIPFKFKVKITSDAVNLILNDRTWIGRPLTPQESPDGRDYVPAISSFWLGYNRNIGVSNAGPEFAVDNYTEKWVMHLVRWAQRYLQCDPNRTYVSGGSMGGTGAVQLATHFPEVFAAVNAYVPVYSYTWRMSPKGGPSPSARRMVCSCGFFTPQNPARLPDGRDLLDYASGEKNIAASTIDMPPIFATNGRCDMSIPWVNNPPFYRAANQAGQAICVYWNNGNHGMSSALPEDMKKHDFSLFRYRLNAAFPAFSDCSANGNYGNGDPKDGDLTGWINRGGFWKDTVDTAKNFSMKVGMNYPGIVYPVKCRVTFRRRQQFKPAPGEKLTLKINGTSSVFTVPANGLLTVPVVIESKEPVTVAFAK